MTGTRGARSGKLVSVQWLAEHLDDADVRLVEVDFDAEAYAKEHVRGAVGWSWSTELNDPVRRDVVTPEAFADLLARSGVTLGTRVILYGDNHNWFAAFAAWLLAYHRHSDYALVDGGRDAILESGLPLTTDAPDVPRTEYPVPRVRPELRATREEVLAAVTSGTTTFVDARSPDEYSGKAFAPPGFSGTAMRGGHIPGAVNVPWATAVREDGTFLGVEELEKLYADALRPDREVFTYCRIGGRAAHTWFVLHDLVGREDVRNYDGSWTEYGNLIGVPVEKTARAP